MTPHIVNFYEEFTTSFLEESFAHRQRDLTRSSQLVEYVWSDNQTAPLSCDQCLKLRTVQTLYNINCWVYLRRYGTPLETRKCVFSQVHDGKLNKVPIKLTFGMSY